MGRAAFLACTGKRAYPTKAAAKARAGRQNVYRCPTCDQYHRRSPRSRGSK